jgi:hypothetical protein
MLANSCHASQPSIKPPMYSCSPRIHYSAVPFPFHSIPVIVRRREKRYQSSTIEAFASLHFFLAVITVPFRFPLISGQFCGRKARGTYH